MRTAFINQLVEEASSNEKIYLLIGDLGYNVIEPFANKFPDRFINVGICEQNMAGIAAGLSMTGYNVYIYSIGNFPTLRCIEQIRNDIAYYNNNVKIVAVGAGFAYGSQGVSHHATEDVGIMRSIPNIVVASPSDPYEAKAITKLSASYDGPMYIRLGKAGEKYIHKAEIENLHIGDILPFRILPNSSSAILASGSISESIFNSNHIDGYDLYSLPFIKPINQKDLILISKYNNLLIVEEHQKSCGIGSAIIEQLSDLFSDGLIANFPKIKRIAIDDKFCEKCGSQLYLREQAKLYI